MGREVKRVHLDFDWRDKTMDKEGYCDIWKGYILKPIKCFLCDGKSKNTKGKECPLCEGDGEVRPVIEPPECWLDKKNGYQLWEDTTEGSPITPVFKTPEQLAKHLSENNVWGSCNTSYKAWLKMIKEEGSAPLGVISNGGMESGVEAIYGEEKSEHE
jgi:hypothetical protein